MIDYFIYYTFIKSGRKGDGNVDVQVDCPITNGKSVRKLEKGLMDEFGYDSVVICSFLRFNS